MRPLRHRSSQRELAANPNQVRAQLEPLEERCLLAAHFVPLGEDFQVNRFTAGNQSRPAVAVGGTGSAVVVWQSSGQDGSGDGIFAHRLNSAGLPVESEFQVNTYTSDHQNLPVAAMDGVGNFVIVWSGRGNGDSLGIFAQRYLANGAPIGSEFFVNTYTTNGQIRPAIGMDPLGNFVVAWQSYGQDGSGYGIYAQRFDHQGASIGAEFRVNTYTSDHQTHPSVALDAAGQFVISWCGRGDGDSSGIFARRYDANGVALGGSFRVNTHTTDVQSHSSVAMDASGNFLISWQSENQDGSGTGIYGQRYDLHGTSAGSEFRVHSHTTGDQRNPSVAVDAFGNFVITWQSSGQDGSGYGVYAQRYSASGIPVGGEFQVSTHTTGSQQHPAVAMGSEGNFLIVWQSSGQDSSGEGIFAQRFELNLPKIIDSEFQVNTYTTSIQNHASLAMDALGNYVIVWQSYFQDGSGLGIYAQRYARSGTPIGPEFRVNTFTVGSQLEPSVAMDPAGNFVVAWSGQGPGGDFEIFAQRFNANGFTVGSQILVNTHTTGIQRLAAVAMDAEGNFLITWASNDQDGSNEGIFAQRFAANGTRLGSEFQVNTHTTNSQTFPKVAMDAAGNAVIVWISDGQDGSGEGIFGQRFNANGEPIGSEFQVNTYTTGSQSAPAVAMDSHGRFVVTWESFLQGGPVFNLFAQRFDANGIPLGPEFLVNTYTTGVQHRPRVAANSAGEFLIAWTGSGEGDSVGVFVQRFAPNGTPIGNEFRANQYTTSSQMSPALALRADGGFVIAWESPFQDEDSLGILARQFTPQPYSTTELDFRANTHTTSSQSSPAVASNPLGNTVAVWQSDGQDGSSYGIYAQRYDASGSPIGDEFRINLFTANAQQNPAVAMDSVGNFVVVWEGAGVGDSAGIFARRFQANGIPLGSDFRVNAYTTNAQQNASVAMDDMGNFVIVWQSLFQDGSNWGIFGQRYTNSGAPAGSEFLINSFTTSFQLEPSVSMDANGNFIVAWNGAGEGDSSGIFAKRFNAAGTPLGSEFRVNTHTPGNQRAPSVAMDPAGNFLIAWQSSNQDGDSYGIYGQRYHANGATLGPEFRINSHSTGSQRDPSAAADGSGNYVIVWQSEGQDGSGWGIFARRFDSLLGVPLEVDFRINTTTSLDQQRPSVTMDSAGNFFVAWKSDHDASANVHARKFFFNPPPTVAEVLVRGSTWNAALPWYPIPAGSSNQLAALPWTNINQLRIVFSAPVEIASDTLQLLGINIPDYAGLVSGFEYDSETFTATWTFSVPFTVDKLRVRLADGAVLGTNGQPLDGEWTDGSSRFPSGNGTPRGAFEFRFNVLPGNANYAGTQVNAIDWNFTRNRLFENVGDPAYSLFADINANGTINPIDWNGVRARLFTSLPAGDPAGESALPLNQSIFPAHDAVYLTESTAFNAAEGGFLTNSDQGTPSSPLAIRSLGPAASIVDALMIHDYLGTRTEEDEPSANEGTGSEEMRERGESPSRSRNRLGNSLPGSIRNPLRLEE